MSPLPVNTLNIRCVHAGIVQQAVGPDQFAPTARTAGQRRGGFLGHAATHRHQPFLSRSSGSGADANCFDAQDIAEGIDHDPASIPQASMSCCPFRFHQKKPQHSPPPVRAKDVYKGKPPSAVFRRQAERHFGQ